MKQNGVFRFEDAEETKNLAADYTYADEWFEEDAAILSPQLRGMSLCLCMSAFPNLEEPVDRQSINVEKLMQEIGFQDFRTNEDFRCVPEEYTIGIFAARKDVSIGEESCAIYAVGFRGASYGKEWYGNTKIGEEGIPYGFRIAVEKTLRFLKDYLEYHREDAGRRTILWISGYSRAGTVAGLAGAAITDDAESWGISKRDIHVYTFEAPRSFPVDTRREYPNIHNTISRMDMVPLIAPEVWGFCRPGSDDTILPSPGDPEWEVRFAAVKKRLQQLNPSLDLTAVDFTPVAIAGTGLAPIMRCEKSHRRKGKLAEWWYSANPGEYYPRFIFFMGEKIAPSVGKADLPNRTAFAHFYEESFALIAQKYLGAEKEQRLLIRSVLLKLLDDLMKPVPKTVTYLILRNGKTKLLRKTAAKWTSAIISRLLSKDGFGGTKEELEEMRGSIEKMTYYFLYCASRDVQENDLAFLGTLGANIELLLWAHAPELIYSWLMTEE